MMLALGAASAVAFIALGYAAKTVSPVSPFLYANARIQARSVDLIKDDRFHAMTSASTLSELQSMLRDTSYGAALDKQEIASVRDFHQAIETTFFDHVNELYELSPEKTKSVFKSYIRLYEAEVVKTIYRAARSETRVEGSLLTSIGELDDVMTKRLADVQSVSDLNVVLMETLYAPLFEKKHDSVEEFEVAVDSLVINSLIEELGETRIHEWKTITEILNTRVDILNLMALIKFKIRGIEKARQKALLVRNETRLSELLDDLVESESPQESVSLTKGSRYHDPLKKALGEYEKDSNAIHFEVELQRYYKRFVVDDELNHVLGPYPLFSYLVKREAEKRNLITVSECVNARLKPEEVRGLIA